MGSAAPAPPTRPSRRGRGVPSPIRRLAAVPTPLVFAGSIAIAIVLLWRQGSLAELGAASARFRPRDAAATFGLYLAGLALLCLRWHALVRMAGGASRFLAAADLFLTSVVVNYAAPIGLAVPTRAAFTTRDLGLSVGRSGAVVAWEALLDVAALALIGAGWVAIGGPSVLGVVPSTAKAAALIVAAVGVVAGLALAATMLRSPGVRDRVRGVGSALARAPVERPRWTIAAAALTGVYWVLQLVILARLLIAFGVAAPLDALLGVMGLPVLVGMLSPVPGGAGVREALMVAAGQVEGIDGAVVLLAAVVYRTALFVAVPVLYVAVRVATGFRGPGRPAEGGIRG